MRARILIVDDHALLRKGSIATLHKHDPELEFFEAANGIEAIEMAGKCEPDLILMDNLMPKFDSVHAVMEIRKKYPEMKIIMVSMDLSEDVMIQTMSAGVKGFVHKDAPEPELPEAVHKVLKGKYHLPTVALLKAQKLTEVKKRNKGSPGIILSDREKQVLKMLVLGYSSRQIGAELSISERTVDFHRANLREKTSKENTAALIRFALKANIID
jgi:two-component system, NarL family, response regulator NreC